MSGERKSVALVLSADEALVLFDWLARTSDAGEPVPFAHHGEQRVLGDALCRLERELVEPFRADYADLLDRAREAVRDDVGDSN